MSNGGLGRAVLELSIEDKAFNRDLGEAEQHAEALGRRFREVGRSLDEVARGMSRAGARVLDPLAEGMSRAGQAAQQAAQAAQTATPAPSSGSRIAPGRSSRTTGSGGAS